MTSLLKSCHRISAWAASVLLLSVTLAAAGWQADGSSAEAQRYINDIKALTTPAMEGRGDGTKGLSRAAHLIEQRFKSLRLEPAGTHSYFQPFTVVTGARLKDGNHFESGKIALKLNQDFVPFSFSASGLASASVVFVGYGASAPEFGYDDYDSVDVKDKIVVLLRYEPP